MSKGRETETPGEALPSKTELDHQTVLAKPAPGYGIVGGFWRALNERLSFNRFRDSSRAQTEAVRANRELMEETGRWAVAKRLIQPDVLEAERESAATEVFVKRAQRLQEAERAEAGSSPEMLAKIRQAEENRLTAEMEEQDARRAAARKQREDDTRTARAARRAAKQEEILANTKRELKIERAQRELAELRKPNQSNAELRSELIEKIRAHRQEWNMREQAPDYSELEREAYLDKEAELLDELERIKSLR